MSVIEFGSRLFARVGRWRQVGALAATLPTPAIGDSPL